MKRKVFRIAGVAVILWGAGVLAVNNLGYASCVPATGFTGFIRKAFFAPTAACAINTDSTCKSVGAACSVNNALSPGNGTQGKCANTSSGCACNAN